MVFGGSVRLRDVGSLTIAEWFALRMPRGFRLAACGTECSGVDLSAVELNRVRVGRGSVGEGRCFLPRSLNRGQGTSGRDVFCDWSVVPACLLSERRGLMMEFVELGSDIVPDHDPRYWTADGFPITDGAVLWNYYDLVRVTVRIVGTHADKNREAHDRWDGWFNCAAESGGLYVLNGERLSMFHPFTKERAVPKGSD